MNETVVTVRDFILPARIGIYPEEHLKPQNIMVNADIVLTNPVVAHDKIEDTYSYEGIVKEIRRLSEIHHNLVEILAENIASYVLSDSRISRVIVQVEKLELLDKGRLGCKIIRHQS